MQIHSDLAQEASILQADAFAQHDMPHQWVLALEECRSGHVPVQLIFHDLAGVFTQVGQRPAGLHLAVEQSQILSNGAEQAACTRLPRRVHQR